MDKYQILALMMRSEHQCLDANLYSLSALFADRLARVADRLTEEELNRFIEIGAAIYHAGLDEFGTGVPLEDLFPANENWPFGPPPGSGGFRNR